MEKVKFSIVIPTRNRCSTLHSTLLTCSAQTFRDFEVVIADNAGTDQTREVVEQINDARLRYIRYDQLVSMTENWNRALLEARGEYVTVLGSDDGLVDYALQECARIIEASGAAAVRWDWAVYNWPGTASRENLLYVSAPGEISWQDSTRVIDEVATFKRWYTELPMLYNSVIKRSLLNEMAARMGGKYFRAQAPDIFSGFMVAMSCPKFVRIQRCLGIAGLSASGNGSNVLAPEVKSEIAREFVGLNASENLGLHETLPDLPNSIPVHVMDCFRKAREFCQAGEKFGPGADNPTLIKVIFQDFWDNSGGRAIPWPEISAKIQASSCTVPELESLASEFVEKASSIGRQQPVLGCNGKEYWLDLSRLKLAQVHEAATMIATLFQPQGEPLVHPNARAARVRGFLKDWLPPALIRHLRAALGRASKGARK